MTTNPINEGHIMTEKVGAGVLVLIAVTVVAFVGMLFVPTSRTDAAAGLLSDFLILALLVCAVDALTTVRGTGHQPDRDAELNSHFGRIAFIGGVAASMISLVLNFIAAISKDDSWQSFFWRGAVALAASVAVLVAAILIELVLRATRSSTPTPTDAAKVEDQSVEPHDTAMS